MRFMTLVSLFGTLAAQSWERINVITSSASGDAWSPQEPLTWGPDYESIIDVTVDRTAVLQEVLGFGSAATDTSAFNAMVLMNSTLQEEFVEALWGGSGLGLSIARITLNSADYSFKSFNYDNVTDDFTLSQFDHTLGYDQQRVMPLLRLALARATSAWNNTIRLFSSPWSPPGWMKGNGNMIDSSLPCLKNDTAAGESYKQTWANYILAWLQAYTNAGFTLWGLTPQNEPEAQQQIFESCAYTVDGMVEFIANYLGPTVKAVFPNIQIMGYDHNKIDSLKFMSAIYGNSTSNSFVDGTAVHWYDYMNSLGLENLDAIYALNPTKFLLGTEACYLESLVEDWRMAELYQVDIIGDLNHHVGGWVYWNSLLLAGDMYPQWYGGPNHDGTRSFGDPVLFEFNATGTQRLLLQPPYYVLGHFSRFARPGSHVIGVNGSGIAMSYADYEAVRNYAYNKTIAAENLPLLATAFLSEDGLSVSVVVTNPNDAPMVFKLRDSVGGRNGQPRSAAATLAGHSMATYTFMV